MFLQLITREAICYGSADSSYETSLVSWALPYAKRYIYNTYPDRYFQLKHTGFENLNRLRTVVVEKLFFRKVIRRSKIASTQQFECNCLLQGDILYTTPESDSHSIFMELSSFLLDGIPQLPLANFLHMIETMEESGSSDENIESFISNSQKLPKHPGEESGIYILQSGTLTPALGSSSSNVTNREKLRFGKANPRRAFSTGRRGELFAFNYLCSKNGEKKSVKWVNEMKESGLPYDIIVGGEEYIEVKSTTSRNKDWFEISVGEWQFAVEKGESFSIAHVALMDERNNTGRVTMYKDPVSLCRLRDLQLAVLMAQQPSIDMP
ncbi:hypothetical protein ABFS83_14G172700 [Erythranthe nasuta]